MTHLARGFLTPAGSFCSSAGSGKALWPPTPGGPARPGTCGAGPVLAPASKQRLRWADSPPRWHFYTRPKVCRVQHREREEVREREWDFYFIYFFTQRHFSYKYHTGNSLICQWRLTEEGEGCRVLLSSWAVLNSFNRAGERGAEGGRGSAVSLIFHVGGWNNINISFSLNFDKSNSYFYWKKAAAAAAERTLFSCLCVFWYHRHLSFNKAQASFSTLADPAVISSKQVLWLAGAVSSVLTPGQAGPTAGFHSGGRSDCRCSAIGASAVGLFFLCIVILRTATQHRARLFASKHTRGFYINQLRYRIKMWNF